MSVGFAPGTAGHGGQFAALEQPVQALPILVYEPRVLDDRIQLLLGTVAANVFFPEYFLQVRPVGEAMAYVLPYLLFLGSVADPTKQVSKYSLEDRLTRRFVFCGHRVFSFRCPESASLQSSFWRRSGKRLREETPKGVGTLVLAGDA